MSTVLSQSCSWLLILNPAFPSLMSQLMWKRYLSHRRTANAQVNQSPHCSITQYRELRLKLQTKSHVMRKPVYAICKQRRCSLISIFVVRCLMHQSSLPPPPPPHFTGVYLRNTQARHLPGTAGELKKSLPRTLAPLSPAHLRRWGGGGRGYKWLVHK